MDLCNSLNWRNEIDVTIISSLKYDNIPLWFIWVLVLIKIICYGFFVEN